MTIVKVIQIDVIIPLSCFLSGADFGHWTSQWKSIYLLVELKNCFGKNETACVYFVLNGH